MEWLILGVIILLTVINVPIAFALSITTIVFLLWKGTASLSVVPLNLFSGASSFPLLAIPLFILAGGLMDTSGISLRLVNLANSLVGFIRGGLAMVTVVATMIQSEISGSSVADAAAIGNVVIPAMEKRGYPEGIERGHCFQRGLGRHSDSSLHPDDHLRLDGRGVGGQALFCRFPSRLYRLREHDGAQLLLRAQTKFTGGAEFLFA